MTLDAVCQFNASFADPEDLIFDAVASQVAGVGGSGGDYQMTTGFSYPPTLTTGVFIGRFISGYDGGADTKTGIETEFGLGGWPLRDLVSDLGGGGAVGVFSNNNLSSGTTYNGLHWWIDDLWYQRVFLDGTHTIQNAIDALAVWPAGDAVVATNGVTIAGTTSAATDISFAGSIREGSAAGTFIGTASADRSNGTFSEGTPSLSWVDVAANGQLTVTAAQTAPTPGSYDINLVYDNTAAGGGSYDETVSITVTADVGETERYIPIPVTNLNTTFANLSALETAVAAFASDFSGARTTYGVPTGEPILQLDAGSFGDIDWDDYDLSSRITVRGTGPYGSDGYAPTAGTKVTRVLIDNCSKIRVMGMQIEPSSSQLNGGQNAATSQVFDSQEIEIVRNSVCGDVARSTSELGQTPPNSVQYLWRFNGSTDCKWLQNSLIGYREAGFGAAYSGDGGHSYSASDHELRGNVVAQGHNEGICKFGGVQVNRITVADTLALGRGRRSAGQHRDFIQITAQAGQNCSAVDWIIEGNWMQSYDAWGFEQYMAKQGIWWGAEPHNVNSRAVILDNFFGTPGRCIWGKHGGATVRFNTLFCPIDTLQGDSIEQNPNSPNFGNPKQGVWAANIAAPASWASIASFDENIFTSSGNSAHPWTGPNGLSVADGDHRQLTASGADWSTMGALLDVFDQTFSQPMAVDWTLEDSAANNGKHQVRPREASSQRGASHDLGVEQYKPKAGTRAHWDHANPTGCFQLFKRVFDETDHDHWKDWGWPTAVTAHIYYDPNNEMGGASGTYTSFDANGD